MSLWRVCLSLAVLFAACASTAGVGQELMPQGWKGGPDFDGTKFLGCRLVSPPALSEPHSDIIVAAATPLHWGLEFASVFNQPPPERQVVRLALANGEQHLKDDWTSDHGYFVYVLSRRTMPDGRPIAQQQLRISSKDEILSHLGSARFLKVYYTKNPSLPPLEFATVDLRHANLSTNLQPGASSASPNDTAAAVAAVMACARSQPWQIGAIPGSGLLIPTKFITPTIEAELQARSDFGLALDVMLAETGQNPDPAAGVRQTFLDVGYFYCDAKKFITYDTIAGESYQAKVETAINVAGRKLTELSFWREGRTTDQVLTTNIAMRIADKQLCPGWLGHPRPPG